MVIQRRRRRSRGTLLLDLRQGIVKGESGINGSILVSGRSGSQPPDCGDSLDRQNDLKMPPKQKLSPQQIEKV